MARPLVFKFGGACLLGVEDFVGTADYVKRRVGDGRQAVVVASAMSGTSGNLEELIQRLNSVGDHVIEQGCCSRN